MGLCVCIYVCVCVHPCAEGFATTFTFTTVSQAGGRSAIASLLPTKTLAIGSETRPDQSGVPATLNFCPRCSNLSCLLPWCFHDTSPKPFPPQQRCNLSHFVTAVKGNNHCSNTYNFSDFSPCCSTAILPIAVIELTEYNCQSVLRSAVPLGC